MINQLIDDSEGITIESSAVGGRADVTARLSFRLCMANVLISACQKISDTGKKPYVKMITPCVIRSIRVCLPYQKETQISPFCVLLLYLLFSGDGGPRDEGSMHPGSVHSGIPLEVIHISILERPSECGSRFTQTRIPQGRFLKFFCL